VLLALAWQMDVSKHLVNIGCPLYGLLEQHYCLDSTTDCVLK
jgi:hypothetical protein